MKKVAWRLLEEMRRDFYSEFPWWYGKIGIIPMGITANQAYIRRRYLQGAGVEPLSGRTPSSGWLPGYYHLRNLSHETLSDTHRPFIQTAGPLSCGSATGVTHCLLRAFTRASAVPKINKSSMFDVEMFISEIQAWFVMFKLRVFCHTTCVSVAGTLVARPHSGPCENSRSRSERYVLERNILLHYTPLLFIIYNP
jgi:hypothetical protein